MVQPRIDGIICFGGDRWGDVKRPSQLMLQLSKRVPVVYIEPYLSVTSLLKNWRTAFSAPARPRLRRALGRGVDEAAPGIHVVSSMILTPPNRLSALLPARALAAVSEGQYRRASRRAFRAARRLGITSPAVWVSYPLPLTVAPDGKRHLTVYDCMDRWSEFPDALTDVKYGALVASAEQRLLDRADVVFCSAAGLFEAKRSSARGRTVLVRNGADIEHFSPKQRTPPPELAALRRPVVGYVGALADWVDFELLRSVILSRPDWSFVFIGPLFGSKSAGDARALELISGLPNVHLLGTRPYADVPAYVESFDVATIPFKVNGLTDDTDPIKVYEYLAAGVPVVSTPLPEVLRLPDVRIAAHSADFVRACEEAIGERRNPELVAARTAAAAANSWAARAEVAWLTMLDATVVADGDAV